MGVEGGERVQGGAAARGVTAPLFACANYEDYGYFLTMLDGASVAALEGRALGDVRDPFLRTMLWGALWDQVRDAQLDPARFVRLALRQLPSETDEQLYPNIVGRLTRAMTTYLPAGTRERMLPVVEGTLWAAATDAKRPYSIRRASIAAFIGVAQ